MHACDEVETRIFSFRSGSLRSCGCSRHPGHRASAAHPVQEAGGRRGGAKRAVQLRLPVFLLATRVAEGRGVLDVMAVSTLPSKMRPK